MYVHVQMYMYTHLHLHVHVHVYSVLICYAITHTFLLLCSQTSMLSDRVEAVNQHVNAFDIDAVVKHLRSATLHCSLVPRHYSRLFSVAR